MTTPDLPYETAALLTALDVPRARFTEGAHPQRSPLTGEIIGHIDHATPEAADAAIAAAHAAFAPWRRVPAPRRGELVRLLGEELRAAKDALARLVSIEAGKIPSEGAGEVQEMIDICDFAVGLSRQLYGLTITSERPEHRMMEQYHPAGVVGIISAFNFPVAVWAWNAALALVCGDPVIWKPSEKTPLTALATQALFDRAAARFEDAPAGLCSLLLGGRETGAALAQDPRIAVLSATGSTAMGRNVAQVVAARFGRAILELGGNNASIVCPSADQELALRAVAFAAMGTAGQRCTSLRRLIVHASIHDAFTAKLRRVFEAVPVGNPLLGEHLVGPLIDETAYDAMQSTLTRARDAGGAVTGGERIGDGDSYYVRPALVLMPDQTGPVMQETFAPILYVMKYNDFDQAIALQNGVSQGLSSSIFTRDLRESELFLAASGSDCGIANVNMGPSGAEIGGAFGGEKETGGGRESGSDAWKAYMRRLTSAINYGLSVPLAQGVRFDI
ncbi:L-piperidine-6-carboxylate dehydrogenase [Lichenicoccus sp.]|uniref:L-piperidine-6-carboxylate dehydrogenase n=1 Tax=Lichenicoccus sp. TaxID=2781899 RepID=UPI003D107366